MEVGWVRDSSMPCLVVCACWLGIIRLHGLGQVKDGSGVASRSISMPSLVLSEATFFSGFSFKASFRLLKPLRNESFHFFILFLGAESGFVMVDMSAVVESESRAVESSASARECLQGWLGLQ